MGEGFCVVHDVILTLQGKKLHDFAECGIFPNSGGNTDYVRPEPISTVRGFLIPGSIYQKE